MENLINKTEKEQLTIDYRRNSEKALVTLNDLGFEFLDSKAIWQILIYEFGHCDIPSDVFLEKPTSEVIISIILKFIRENGNPSLA